MDLTDAKLRYNIVVDVCAKLKPKSVIEIGVHNGSRSARFCETIPQGGSYTGYDAWDLVKDHGEVYNGKGPGNKLKAQRMLMKHSTRIKCDLIEGWTYDTLWDKPVSADFVFIDGDHRTDAIRKDFEAVSESKLICFDDCVQNGPEDAGAQPIVDDLMDQGWCIRQIPMRVGFVGREQGIAGWNEIAFAWQYKAIPKEVEQTIEQWYETIQAECVKQGYAQ